MNDPSFFYGFIFFMCIIVYFSILKDKKIKNAENKRNSFECFVEDNVKEIEDCHIARSYATGAQQFYAVNSRDKIFYYIEEKGFTVERINLDHVTLCEIICSDKVVESTEIQKNPLKLEPRRSVIDKMGEKIGTSSLTLRIYLNDPDRPVIQLDFSKTKKVYDPKTKTESSRKPFEVLYFFYMLVSNLMNHTATKNNFVHAESISIERVCVSSQTHQNVKNENQDIRICPFCAEDIKKAAIVCKHCGRDVIPLN